MTILFEGKKLMVWLSHPPRDSLHTPTFSLALLSESSSQSLWKSICMSNPMKTYLHTSFLFILIHFTFSSMSWNNLVIHWQVHTFTRNLIFSPSYHCVSAHHVILLKTKSKFLYPQEYYKSSSSSQLSPWRPQLRRDNVHQGQLKVSNFTSIQNHLISFALESTRKFFF